MKTNIQIFTSEVFGEIRTCQVNNQIMFVGKDVATALGYTDPQKALKMHVDNDDKLTRQIVVSGQGRRTYIINESGLYSLILSSKLPQAKAFKRWVTAEVLPQIRKTGGYIPTRDASGRELSGNEILERADVIVGRTLRLLNEPAYRSRDYASGCNIGRSRRSKNDSIYERLDVQFTFEQAMQFSVAVKGADVTRNSVQQMLKNWRNQRLILQTDEGGYRKVLVNSH